MEGAPNKENSTKPLKKLTVEDGLSYLKKIKESQPQLYGKFLHIMTMLRLERLDRVGVIKRVSKLFRGYPELIEDFKIFLPRGYEIEVQPIEQTRHVPVAKLNGTISSVPQYSIPIFGGSQILTEFPGESQVSTAFPSESQVSAAIDSESSSDSDRSRLVDSLISFRGHTKKENEEDETSSSCFPESSSSDASYRSSCSSPEHFEESSEAAASVPPTEDNESNRETSPTFSGLLKK